MIQRCLVIAVCLSALWSCHRKDVTVQDLERYLADKRNRLTKSTNVNELDMKVSYRPADLWVGHDLQGVVPTDTMVDSLRRKYADYYYFFFSLSKGNKEALQVPGNYDYGEVIRTMAFHMQDYVMLASSEQDTIAVADFVLDRTYGMARSTDILFAFGKAEIDQGETISFIVKEFGLGTGDQRFDFQISDISAVPQVDFRLK